MRITIPDDLADVYVAYATRQNRSLDTVIEAQLSKFKALEPGKRTLTIGGEVTQRLETALGGLPIRTPNDLVTRVEDLAAISFQHIRLDFSPAHLAELAHRAERQGKSVETLVIETVDRMAHEFFWQSGGGERVLQKSQEAKAS